MFLHGGGGIDAEPYHRAAHLTNLSRDMHFDGLMRGPRKSPRVQQQAAPAQSPPTSRAAVKAAASAAARASVVAKAAKKAASDVQHAAAAALQQASRPLSAKRKGGDLFAEFDSAGGGQGCAKRPAAPGSLFSEFGEQAEREAQAAARGAGGGAGGEAAPSRQVNKSVISISIITPASGRRW